MKLFIRYKKNHEKIAMGLLSLMPKEKNIKQLMTTMKSYEDDTNQKLFLWREDEDFIGIIGVHLLDDSKCMVQHICVSPSHRNQGIGHIMLEHVKKMYPAADLYGSEDVKSFYEKCIHEL